eukprot:1788429-Prymnesium_polylepis.1
MHSPVCGPASGSTPDAQRAQQERRSSIATPAELPETLSDGPHPAQPMRLLMLLLLLLLLLLAVGCCIHRRCPP